MATLFIVLSLLRIIMMSIAVISIAYKPLKNECKLSSYTLVIEHYMLDFEESTYQIKKFIDQQERTAFINNQAEILLSDGYNQEGRAFTNGSNSIYIVFHEID